MKVTLAVIVLVVVMGLAVEHRDTLFPESPTYVKDETMEVVKEKEPELDTIERASQELERINAELDAEEAKLIEEKKAIDARLEKLRETRANFQ